jgi:hypothetical protein
VPEKGAAAMSDSDRRVFYILDNNGEVKPITDSGQWAKWLETARESLCTAKTVISKMLDVWVVTVFLGTDDDFSGEGKPLPFATMIFRKHNGEMAGRYAEVRTTDSQRWGQWFETAFIAQALAIEIAKVQCAGGAP